VLSDDEWPRFYEAAQPHLRPILLLAYHLGQRLSEIVELTWDRVDLRRGFILLRPVDTKTKQRREIPLTPMVKATLQQLAKVRRLETSRVFLYKSALNDASLHDFRFHDLRHCASQTLGGQV
jgi:integrase